MRIVTFDIETIGDFRNGGDFSNLEITVVGAHDSDTNVARAFVQDEFKELWQLLEGADALVGYNSDHFDIPILNRYYAGDLERIRSIDLLKEIKKALGRRIKLDNVAIATLGRGKSGNGLDAQDWWAKGEVEKVKSYCLDDVILTKELYDYALKNKSLKYSDFDGVREIKLDTSWWEKGPERGPSMTHTLPF